MMDFLRKMFGPTNTRLEQFIRKLNDRSIQTACDQAREEKLRASLAISLLTLYTARHFCDGLRTILEGTPHSLKTGTFFDVAAFEGAAYAHYLLMREYMESDDLQEDPYFSCLSNSAQLTGSIIRDHTGFQLPDDFFFTRAWNYGHKSGRLPKDVAFEFGQIVQSSIKVGRPVRPAEVRVELENLSIVPIQSAVGIWHQGTLGALTKSATTLYEFYKAE